MPRHLLAALPFLVAAALAPSRAGADEIAWDKIIGADHTKLDDAQRTRVVASLNSLKNTRGCRDTLAACLAKGDQTARRHAGYVIRMVRKKKPDDAIAQGLKLRAESAFPEEVFEIDLADHPSAGDKNAKVVLVEYACFQCPYCAHLAPQLENLGRKFNGKVVHYYKFFPVRSHPRGVPTALAAVAAMRQNKFWEMYSLMYANRANLEEDDIRKYATRLKLDLRRFDLDTKDSALMKYIEKDKVEGMRLGVEGTPTFFVNGKLYQGSSDYEEISDRLGEELDIIEGRIK